NEALEHSSQRQAQINDDLVNLLSSIQMPIIMVDHDLRIRRFTSMADQVFNIAPTDIGRPITDLSPKLDLPNLPEVLTDAIGNLRSHEQEVQDRKGHWYSLRVRPYVTHGNKIDGAVIAMVDIDELKQDKEKLRLLVELSSEPMIVWDFEKGIVEWN